MSDDDDIYNIDHAKPFKFDNFTESSSRQQSLPILSAFILSIRQKGFSFYMYAFPFLFLLEPKALNPQFPVPQKKQCAIRFFEWRIAFLREITF